MSTYNIILSLWIRYRLLFPVLPPNNLFRLFTFFIYLAPKIPDVGELMIPVFPTEANFVDAISADNSWCVGIFVSG